jgi:hypothetical protein
MTATANGVSSKRRFRVRMFLAKHEKITKIGEIDTNTSLNNNGWCTTGPRHISQRKNVATVDKFRRRCSQKSTQNGSFPLRILNIHLEGSLIDPLVFSKAGSCLLFNASRTDSIVCILGETPEAKTEWLFEIFMISSCNRWNVLNVFWVESEVIDCSKYTGKSIVYR